MTDFTENFVTQMDIVEYRLSAILWERRSFQEEKKIERQDILLS